MAISSKRIVAFINNSKSSFTAFSMAQELLASKTDKKSKSGKKKRKNGIREREAFSRIKIILDALIDIGYLQRQRKTFVKVPDFKLKGRIKVNTSGNGVLETDEGDEIIIWKESINNAHNNDRVEAEIIDFKKGEYVGRITNIIQRSRERYFAKVERIIGDRVYYRLLDIPGDIEVCSGTIKEQKEGDFVIVKLSDHYISGRQECIVEKTKLSREEYDVKRIIIKHSLPEDHKDYKELDDIENNIPQREFKNRKDYRNLFTVTIDGERAKDFDDAISLEKSENQYRLYIHIADVSAYVRKGSELDNEALKRGTSFYLGNCVISMLPEILSNNLCSLREGEDRLTLSVEIVFDKEGNEVERSFHRGLIKVNKRLTYKIADDEINKKGRGKAGVLLKQMNDLADILKKRRLSMGRIDLNIDDYELIYEGENFTEIEFAERLKSHMIIEEFMLSANEVVSRALTGNKIPALYRVHENMSDESLTSLRRFIKSLGLRIKEKGNIGVSLQGVINEVRGKEYEQVVNFIMLKSFMQAYYGPEPLGHFGLGFADYTHFTSPIRRYPDLIVHRCLKSLIDKTKHPYDTPGLGVIGETTSDMERIAQYAERDLFKLISCRYLQDRIGEVFDAVISGISKAGFFVTLVDKPIEGMVPLRFLTDDYYLINEDKYTVIGKRLGRRFRLGDLLKVTLKDVSIETMRIDFDVA